MQRCKSFKRIGSEITSEDDSDVCNLGSINISRINDIKEFEDVVYLGSKFLVCGSIRSELPYEKMARVRAKNMRIGLGLMGLHEWLLQKGYDYEVVPELHQWLEVYKTMSEVGANELSDKWGVNRPKKYRAIAPTGTIGILNGTSTGIEPIFSVATKRRYLKGASTWVYEYVVSPTAKYIIDKYGVKPSVLEQQTAYELAKTPEKRIKFQYDIQKYVDHAISSTINLAQWGTQYNNEDTARELAKTLKKYAHGLRGITCYPDGAIGGQPLTVAPYGEAIKKQGIIFEEKEDVCKGGVCGI